MYKIFLALLFMASNVQAMEVYSRVYVAKSHTSLDAILEEIGASEEDEEEIIRLNPQLERLDRIPAGTILNLSLYRGTTPTVSSSLKRLKIEKKVKPVNRLILSPLYSINSFKTGLNNDSEINSSARTYGLGIGLDLPHSSMLSTNFYSRLTNVEFTTLKIKQMVNEDKDTSPNENRFNYDIGMKGTFNKENYFNSFALSLSRKVEHQYYFSKNKNFFASNISDFTEISKFSGWWLGAEFSQSLPFFNLPLEARLGYNFILDGNVTTDDSSTVKNLNGSSSSISIVWKSGNNKSFVVSYENFSYQSEFSSDGRNIGIMANFAL